MKVLHLIDSGGLYGAEKVLLALAAEQSRRGMQVTVGSIATPGVEKAVDSAARSLNLDTRRIELAPGLRWGNVRHVGRFLQMTPCDVVHTHGYKPNVLIGLQPRREERPAHVITLHGWTSTGQWNMNAAYECFDRALLRRADAVVIVSGRMRHRVGHRVKVSCIPNGIGPVLPQPAALAPNLVKFCGRAPTVVAVGRLSSEKDHVTLLRAIAHPRSRTDLQLVLLGDGPLRTQLQSLAHQLGLHDRVLFAGYVADAWRIFPLCRALVISSVFEGLPITLLEAMRVGLPIVSTMVGEIEAATGGGQGAWPFAVGDVTGLAHQLGEMLRLPTESESRAAFARDRCRELYSMERVAADYEVVYRIARDRASQRVP